MRTMIAKLYEQRIIKVIELLLFIIWFIKPEEDLKDDDDFEASTHTQQQKPIDELHLINYLAYP
jgi:hypothetical protein